MESGINYVGRLISRFTAKSKRKVFSKEEARMKTPHGIGLPYLSGPVQILVHDRPLAHRDDGFRGWSAVAQSTMRSLSVVVFSPLLDDGLRLFQ